MTLKKFEKNELVISRNDAWKLLEFFFRRLNVAPNQITPHDISFAQALLLEAADASYKMGYVEILFEHFFMANPRSFEGVKDLLVEFSKDSLKHWWKNASEDDLKDPKLYLTVVNQLRRNFTSVWRIREQTGELIY